jgi:hypothetical protein
MPVEAELFISIFDGPPEELLQDLEVDSLTRPCLGKEGHAACDALRNEVARFGLRIARFQLLHAGAAAR